MNVLTQFNYFLFLLLFSHQVGHVLKKLFFFLNIQFCPAAKKISKLKIMRIIPEVVLLPPWKQTSYATDGLKICIELCPNMLGAFNLNLDSQALSYTMINQAPKRYPVQSAAQTLTQTHGLYLAPTTDQLCAMAELFNLFMPQFPYL